MTMTPLLQAPEMKQGQPTTLRLLRDQVGYSLVDLWRTRVVLIFTFLLPLVLLVLVGIVAGNETIADESGVRVMQFMTPVAGAMGVLFATLPTMAISLADARERGILKRVRGTPLPVWIYLAGRIGAAVVFAFAALMAAVAVGVLAYDVQIVWRTVPATVVTVVVGIAAFTAMGMAVAALARSATVAEAGSVAASVVLMFISGLFTVGGQMPAWLSTMASVFPLKPFAEALQDQFNPFHTGAGWDLSALAVLAAWGLAVTLVTVRAFGWEQRGTPGRAGAGARAYGGGSAAGRPLHAITHRPPSAPVLVLDQARAAARSAWRDPGSVFFAVIMPVGLYAFTITVQGSDVAAIDGVPFVTFYAASMVAWGLGVAAFLNLAEQVALARDRGVLKRLRGTPLAPWQYLAGRSAAGVGIAVLLAALVLGLGTVFYDLDLTARGVGLGLVVLVIGTLTFAACGFALVAVGPSAKAVGAVGLVILLPLAFFSDVFAIGGPEWMSTVGALFPLKHVQNALALAWDPAGPIVGWVNLSVLVLWAAAATAVAVRFFHWEVRTSG